MRALVSSWIGLSLLVGLIGLPHRAHADQLSVEQHQDETGYLGIEEHSYETIIEASRGYSATLRIRTALHNASLSPRDAVATFALPATGQIRGLRVAHDGQWSDGISTTVHRAAGRRDPGSVFVRRLPSTQRDDLPVAELVTFGLEPGHTIQVELIITVYPRLRGGNWELDLPARGHESSNLSRDRRVLVQGLGKDEPFWCEAVSNQGQPYIITSGHDNVTARWPAHLTKQQPIESHYELIPGPANFDDGEFRVYLRLGQTAPPHPDHLVLVVDRSLSTSSMLQGQLHRMLGSLLDDLPPSTTFDALGFARSVIPLLEFEARSSPTLSNVNAREQLRKALDANERQPGTDLISALVTAVARAQAKGARRPMIVVVTDGMLPLSVGPLPVKRAFDRAVGPSGMRPEVLFVVDDPMLARSGLTPDHPIARIAAALGARLSLETVGQLQQTANANLLAAPPVMGGLAVELPPSMVVDHPVPLGLVAGNVAVLTGRYVGQPAPSIKVSGTFGARKTTSRVKATPLPAQPQALAASIGPAAADAAAEGFVRPPWYALDDERTARHGITQAARLGVGPQGYLDRKIFRYYLTTRVFPRARVCYNRALVDDPAQRGRLTLDIEVAKGEVMLAGISHVELEHDDPQFVACMAEAAWALRIPAGRLDDKIYVLHYPLRLVAPKRGQSADVVGLSDDQWRGLTAVPPGQLVAPSTTEPL